MKAQALSVQLADMLADMILNQEKYVPGQKLPNERDFANELGVSRTSIREATKQLEARGLVEIRRGVGTFVTKTPGIATDPLGIESEKEHISNALTILEDWYNVRMILEGEAMEMVAKNATDQELEHLSKLFDEETMLYNSTDREFIGVDQHFHCTLASATHNIIMSRLIPTLHASVYYDIVRSFFKDLRHDFGRNAESNHRAILNHLKARDGCGANLAMRYHMIQAIEDIQKLKNE